MYTRIESRFWKDDKVRELSGDGRLLMLYLLTSQHRNLLGIYFLPAAYACFDLDWDVKRFHKGLGELLFSGQISYDEKTHVILVPNFLKHNPLENQNQVKAGIAKLNELPQTPVLRDFQTVLNLFAKPFYKPLQERLRERLEQGFGKQGEGEGKEKPCKPCAPKTEHVFVRHEYPSEFEEFWSGYPRKRAKPEALKAWRARINNGHTAADILQAVSRYVAEVRANQTPAKFIKLPATFLGPGGHIDDHLRIGPDEHEDPLWYIPRV